MLRDELRTNLASPNRFARIGVIWDVDFDLMADSSQMSLALGLFEQRLDRESDDRVREHLRRFIQKWRMDPNMDDERPPFAIEISKRPSELREFGTQRFHHDGRELLSERNTALFSYSHTDDEYHRNILTIMASVMNEAVHIHSGRRDVLEVVYDLRNIDVGDEWKNRIDLMIGEARIFIPILSPSYFESDECMDELRKFLAHLENDEKRRVIMPIRFVDFDTSLLEQDTAASKLLQRQHVDWTWLRFKVDDIKKSEQVTKAIDAFGYQLVKTISEIRRADAP